MRIERNRQKGAALMSTLFFLVITTAIAMGALMLSTVQVKVASSVARWEAAYSAAEGGINYAIPMIKYGHFDGFIPPQYCGFISGGCGLPGAPPPFVTELQADLYNPDTSNILIPDNPGATGLAYIVNIDVDPIGTSISAGSGIEAAWAYHGGAYGSGLYRAYRVTSEAATPTGSSRARIQQVLWLRAIM